MSAYCARSVDGLLASVLTDLPSVMITGPRGSGKTTTAARQARSVVRLDRPAEAAAFIADPDVALTTVDEPALLDEWQEVPQVLGAVKRAVDNDSRPGRFLLTGSVHAELDAKMWPGTGRIVRLPLYGLTIREQRGHATTPSVVERIIAREEIGPPPDPPDLAGYLDLMVRSGFPEPALRLRDRARRRWLVGYVDQLLTRDVPSVSQGRDFERLRRFFEVYCLNTAGVVSDQTLWEAADISRVTALEYERLFHSLFVTYSVPAWTSNRLKRVARRHKRYLADPALVAAHLQLDVRSILRDGNMLGRLLDSFVAAQLRAEVAVSTSGARLFHLREEHGRHEIDLLMQSASSSIVAVEVKAHAAPNHSDSKHMEWLRGYLGDQFAQGLVLHTGPRSYSLGERITAAPIASLWG